MNATFLREARLCLELVMAGIRRVVSTKANRELQQRRVEVFRGEVDEAAGDVRAARVALTGEGRARV